MCFTLSSVLIKISQVGLGYSYFSLIFALGVIGVVIVIIVIIAIIAFIVIVVTNGDNSDGTIIESKVSGNNCIVVQ